MNLVIRSLSVLGLGIGVGSLMNTRHLIIEGSRVSKHTCVDPVCGGHVVKHLLTFTVAAVLILHLVQLKIVSFLVESLLAPVYPSVWIW